MGGCSVRAEYAGIRHQATRERPAPQVEAPDASFCSGTRVQYCEMIVQGWYQDSLTALDVVYPQ